MLTKTKTLKEIFCVDYRRHPGTVMCLHHKWSKGKFYCSIRFSEIKDEDERHFAECQEWNMKPS